MVVDKMVFLWALGYSLVWLFSDRQHGGGVLLPVAYVAAFIGWILYTGRAASFGLVAPKGNRWPVWPLLLFSIRNLLHGGGGLPDPIVAIPVLLAAILEELLFRGALLPYLKKYGEEPAVMLSSLAFGAGHLFTGGGVLQFGCALSAGVCYGVVTLESGSIFPAMLAHFLVNLTGFTAENDDFLWVWAAVSLIWGIVRLRKRKKDEVCNFT